MIYVGTSGFSYKEWKGIFYPEKLPQKQYLSYYGEQFRTTEINNTFYRFPSPEVVSNWAQQVPADFRFALKLSQRITHRKKLQDVDEEMRWFLTGAEPLGDRLGCVLVQLPPWYRQNLKVLEAFLEAYSKRVPLAFEFRHDSWYDEETYRLLENYGAALGVVEDDKREAVRRVTGPFVYSRLRRSDSGPDQLAEWASWFRELEVDAYVYLKHAGQAPVYARALLDML